MKNVLENYFNIKNKVFFITGGAGLLGKEICEVVLEFGGIPIIFDVSQTKSLKLSEALKEKYPNSKILFLKGDVSKKNDVKKAVNNIIKKYKKIDVLINNAEIDSKVKKNVKKHFSTFENYSIKDLNNEINVGLNGAVICTQVIGSIMKKNKKGIIINISSDLGIIAPDQRIYNNNMNNYTQAKPVSYSIIKHGIIGLTKYTASYWAKDGIRCNALCPGSIFNNHPKNFKNKLSKLIPMNRMANLNEYKSAIIFLSSDASSYMNGSSLIIDGGRSIW